MNNLPFLLDENEISRWAYYYCRKIKDDSEIREFITDPYWAYHYCRYVNDDPEIREFIVDSERAYLYCKYVNKDDKRLLKLVKKRDDIEYE